MLPIFLDLTIKKISTDNPSEIIIGATPTGNKLLTATITPSDKF